ncbi:hypothetical protein J14TS2_28780 [Bacillus sp. J14TS2]|uniref:hypothetical protein n=1 Tax=Bacillus sp. J14TS2 TaxID=2807188 RepID=UPI001B2610BC|nr:hypothetical protein [Bacillus sp. J14TS2]GIN72403.1 hypothetical protein J14TS2_28780 [Bacillus sp. J14TS2]
MKKILTILSFLLFISVFNVNFASAAYKSGNKTSNKVAMGGRIVHSFKFYLLYSETYNSASTTSNNVTYRESYFSMDRKTPAIASASSATAYYNGNTKVSETGAFSKFSPSQIVPANHQVRNYRQSTTKSVKKKTGKATNTSSIVVSCSAYAPCIFNQKVTLSYIIPLIRSSLK